MSKGLGCTILAGLMVFALERWSWVCFKSVAIYFLASQVCSSRCPKALFIVQVFLFCGQFYVLYFSKSCTEDGALPEKGDICREIILENVAFFLMFNRKRCHMLVNTH